MQVGTKELKNRLSHYLRLVRDGEVVLVTDRGTVVAEIRRTRPALANDDVLRALAKDGLVTLGRGRLPDLEPVPLAKRGSLSTLIVEDRG